MLVVGCASSTSSTAPTTTAVVSNATNSLGGRTFGSADATEPQTGGNLVMGVEAETEAMDPARVPLAASGYFLASAVFDSLATLDKDAKPVPFLAKSIEPSDGAKTWTITLRDGVKFHNGDPLDAAAVKADLDFFQESAITSSFFRTVAAIEVKGALEVVVRLSEPWVAFPVALTTQIGYVMHPSMITDPELSKTPIGTGPFAYKDHKLNDSWKLEANRSYWRKDSAGRSLPYLDGIEFKVRVDEGTRISEFTKGEIDLIHTVKPAQVQALRKLPQYKRVEYADGEKDFLTLNTEKAPFNELAARRAMAYAVDVERWRTEVSAGVKPAVNSPFGPTQPGYSEDSGYPKYNLDEAKKLVKEYENKTGKPFEFEYISGDDPSDRAEGQLIVSMLKDAGMKVTIKALPQANLIAFVVTGTYQVSAWRNFGMPDPDADTVWWRSENVVESGVSLNTARFKDAEIDGAIDKALAATSPTDRDAAYRVVAKRMGEQVPYVWLGRVVWNLAAQDRVNGIYAAANGSIQTLGEKSWLGEVWIKK